MSIVLQAEEVFFYMVEGKRLTRSIVGINQQNKFRTDSVHGNREAFENILLIPLTMIPQTQYHCLKNREDGLKPAVVKRCNNKSTKPEAGKEQEKKKNGERCNTKPISLGFALQGGLAPPVRRRLPAAETTGRNSLCQSALTVPGRQTRSLPRAALPLPDPAIQISTASRALTTQGRAEISHAVVGLTCSPLDACCSISRLAGSLLPMDENWFTSLP